MNGALVLLGIWSRLSISNVENVEQYPERISPVFKSMPLSPDFQFCEHKIMLLYVCISFGNDGETDSRKDTFGLFCAGSIPHRPCAVTCVEFQRILSRVYSCHSTLCCIIQACTGAAH
jgi:hypothetical protein